MLLCCDFIQFNENIDQMTYVCGCSFAPIISNCIISIAISLWYCCHDILSLQALMGLKWRTRLQNSFSTVGLKLSTKPFILKKPVGFSLVLGQWPYYWKWKKSTLILLLIKQRVKAFLSRKMHVANLFLFVLFTA